MQLSIAFRHMEATDALKEYCSEKVERITKYFPDPIKAHAVFACERGYNQRADVTITLHNGIVIKGAESTEDMYSSIDLVMAKIERQVRRYKEKIRDHRAAPTGDIEIGHAIVSLPESSGDGATASESAAPPKAAKPEVIRTSKFVAKPLNLDEAVMQMNLLGNSFLVYTDAATRTVHVLYDRKDGTYGLIETGAHAAGAPAHQPNGNPQAARR